MKTKVITDAMSDITPSVAATYDIDVLPVGVSLGGSFVMSDQLETEETFNWITENKKTPEFKGVRTNAFVEVFEKYIKQGLEIVFISTGSKTISNYDSACHASTRFPDANIQIIDSHHTSGTLAMIVLMAAKMAQENESANAITIRLERTKDKFKHFGLTNTVEFLKYAGLCPRIIAVGVSLLNAKFEINMKEDLKFDVQMVGTSQKRAMTNYTTNIFKDLKSIDPKRVFLMHTISEDGENNFTELYRRIEDLNYFEEIVVCDAGHHTTSLVGQDGVSVAYQLK